MDNSRIVGDPSGGSGLGDLARNLQKDGAELAISNLKLRALPQAGYPESITRIDASGNTLSELPEALVDLVPNLAALDVSRNALSSLPADLGLCPSLATLSAERNQIGELSFLSFALPALQHLVFDRNGLCALPPALWMCPRLTHVSLCCNKLTANSIRMPVGGAAAPLEHLDLGENRLGALPPLSQYPRLREVHVQQNGIRELPAAEFAPLSMLQTLDVSMNDVSQLPPQLALLPVLQNLTIVGNPIRSIPQNVQQRGATAVIDLLRKRLPA